MTMLKSFYFHYKITIILIRFLFNFFGNYIFHKKYSCFLVVMCLQYYFTSQKVSCEISFSLRPLGNYYKMKITFSKSKVEYVHYKLKFLHVYLVEN